MAMRSPNCRKAFAPRDLGTCADRRHRRRGAPLLCVQFHLEVVHTPDGAKTAREFRAQGRRAQKRLDDARLPRGGDRLDPRASRRRAACSADSRAASIRRSRRVLIHEAIGDRLDLRLRRSRHAAPRRGGAGRLALSRPLQYSARACRGERALPRRARRRDEPEEKRKIIGRLFVEVFDAEAKKIAAGRRAARRNSLRKARSIPT